MGPWTESVEAKARIIHGQIAAARALALRNSIDPTEVERPYLDLLNRLYRDEFQFAQLVDSSDLVARFTGPAVATGDPPVSVVASMFSNLRRQIQGIARSIVGLDSDDHVRWPSGLDPHLAGVAQGSLIVGIRIRSDGIDAVSGQRSPPGVSGHVLQAVRDAVKSVANIARYVHDEGVDDEIENAFPDPAIRDTVMVAASKLAPTGRRGIDSLAFYRPDSTREEPWPLTAVSRRVLREAVARPVKVSGCDSFVGIVREIDLDARRFEIRHVEGIGGIRCVYRSDMETTVRQMLDRYVRVQGDYETSGNRKPRLIDVSSMEVLIHEQQRQLL